MSKTKLSDHLFLIAEEFAQDFSLFPQADELHAGGSVEGLLTPSQIEQELKTLNDMDVDSYIARCVTPAEAATRPSARDVLKDLGGRLSEVTDVGPYYSAVLDLQLNGQTRRLGVIAQNRKINQGAWMPEHHDLAAKIAFDFASHSLPILALMDTPGAIANAEANSTNQSHAISRLIAQMCNIEVPTVGIILGLGYSGGAIPLAASNVILSVRDGVFNTIQPQGLASIARKHNLSWQECARYVGVSPCELYAQGNIDGVIDYVPGEQDEQLENLRKSIISSFDVVERRSKELIQEHRYISDHYNFEVERYIERSGEKADDYSEVTKGGASLLHLDTPATQYPNLFGVATRYLRYLGTRRRIKATTKSQYGRLAEQEVPAGELHTRSEREVKSHFESWVQNPDKIIYDDFLTQILQNYRNKQQTASADRGQIARLLLGEPKERYKTARTHLLMGIALYLYNRWKNKSHDNLSLLIEYLKNHSESMHLIRVDDILDVQAIFRVLSQSDEPHHVYLCRHLSLEGQKMLRATGKGLVADNVARNRLTTEFNRMMREGILARADFVNVIQPQADRRTSQRDEQNNIAHARWLLEATFPNLIRPRFSAYENIPEADLTCLDLVQDDDLREDFIKECSALLAFGKIYDYILGNLNQVAYEADKTGNLSGESLGQLLDEACGVITTSQPVLLDGGAEDKKTLMSNFQLWCANFSLMSKRYDFLQSVAEWKQTDSPHLSDTLFVVVTFLFEKLIPEYFQSKQAGKRYVGKIRPRRIGRRKDFWHRLTLAYQDLQIQDILKSQKRQQPLTPELFIKTFFENYEPLNDDLLSSDPAAFPGFRLAIEAALNDDKPPCGVLTGIGDFKSSEGSIQVGVVISNTAFQAGAFDMASAEKFCSLLVVCAQRHLPVLCFISSGGMQTKEGAGALFSMAAVNDRITRFVSDLDLPVIMFGFGDCAGGAQASFVTHPLAHTYYFSGTYMPFAGQIVVQSHLPSTSTLSNYLALVPGAMRGLVRHPFLPKQDEQLRKVDPKIPIPTEDVQKIVADVMARRYRSQDIAAVTLPTLSKKPVVVQPVRRTLIHARGCTAVKLIRIAQRNNIEVVLVQSDPDMDSVAVDMLSPADRVICIGGNTPDESYLNGLSVVKIAEHEAVDSLHPGIGFLAENSQFAELCRNHGVNFIGPLVDSMTAMGNKSNAISTAMKLSVPVVPGSHGILTSVHLAADLAEEIDFPLLIKAVHGGGGKGIQVVERAEDFPELFYRVQLEAKSAFGNADIYLEKYIQSLRHIEVQLLRDMHGNTLMLGLRDCTVQRNKQKVIEESGSTMLPNALEEAVYTYSRAIADEIKYLGAGTVEFIYDLKKNAVYFMEMNTRLQIEHAVTEMVCSVDLVAAQFDIASGRSIEHLRPIKKGYAIEARINAERALIGKGGVIEMRPSPGTVRYCNFPEVPQIEVISAIDTGKVISPFYDSMVAQVIAYGTDRDHAIKRLHEYLERVEIKGIFTNIPLLLDILKDGIFIAGRYDTGYLDELMQRTPSKEFLQKMQDFSGTDDSVDLSALSIEGSDEMKVVSPATGTIYLTSSPTEPAYVSEGDVIDIAATICQIEAMKVFTPISLSSFNRDREIAYPPEQKYRVKRVQYASGSQVNAGDLLFVVLPLQATARKAG